MEQPRRISPDWLGEPVIVAGSGPSLTPEVAHRCRMVRWHETWRVLAVNDAYRVMPWADVLYAADEGWWYAHNGAPELLFGVRATCKLMGFGLTTDKNQDFCNAFPNVQLIPARPGENFSTDPDCIHYGDPEHSGFQAVNLAILLGARFIVLVGFDSRYVEGRAHFFGEHPNTLRRSTEAMYKHMATAFDKVQSPVPIWNATPESAVRRFPFVTLDEALSGHDRLHRHGTELNPRAD